MLTQRRLIGTSDILVLIGDLACFAIFAVLGLRSHEEGLTLANFVRAAVPFQVGWLAAAFAMGRVGRFQVPERRLARKVLATWVPAWIIGLLLRTVVFGRDFAPTFVVVAFLFNGFLLVAWRFVHARISDRH